MSRRGALKIAAAALLASALTASAQNDAVRPTSSPAVATAPAEAHAPVVIAAPPHAGPAPAASAPTSAPTSAPATGPASTTTTASSPAPSFQPPPPAPPMPPDYNVMLTRNVFVRGPAHPSGPIGPESNFGFNGVVIDDGTYTAFIEDLGGKRTMRLKAGDAVGQGKLKSVGDTSIEYEAGGKVTRIQIGQNLLGAPLPPPPPPPPKPVQPPPGGPGGPGAPGQPGGPPMPSGAVPPQPGNVRMRG